MPSAQQKVVKQTASTTETPKQQQQQESTTKTSKDSSLTRTNSFAKQQQTAATGGEKTPPELPEFIKQALATIEKKVRNLEKRRTKLDEYKEIQNKGTVLNEDQLNAVSKYEEVKTCLDLVKDLDKQLNGFAADALKAQKKQAKKEQMEREELVREKLREVERLHALLNAFGDDKVRQDFLEGKFGENPLAKDELDLLDDFDKLVNAQLSKSYENQVNEAVDHLLNLAEAKNKPVLNTTYTELKRLFERIQTSTYWNGEVEVQQQQTATEPQQLEQSNEQDLQQQQQKPSNVNTSTDDFVVVTNVEIKELEHEQQQLQQHQQELVEQGQDPNTFFSTLNRPDNSIKEFLTENNEGLNFLQDSQIYPQEQQQQQQQGDFEFAGKRDNNGFRNNGGYQNNRRPYNNNNGDNGNGDQRRSGGGRGGSYSGGRGGGPGGRGGRGGFNNNRGGQGGQGNRTPFRGKPGFNREAGQQQQPPQSHA